LNNDCDEELDEIDEKIEELQDEADEGSREKQDIQLEIKKLKEQRILVEQAVDIFDEIIAEFEKISEISEDLDVGF
jgi:predicted  nucleic acid-binding Zn-ribbon protein